MGREWWWGGSGGGAGVVVGREWWWGGSGGGAGVVVGREWWWGGSGGGAGVVVGREWWWGGSGGEAGVVVGREWWLGGSGGGAGVVVGREWWWGGSGGGAGVVVGESGGGAGVVVGWSGRSADPIFREYFLKYLKIRSVFASKSESDIDILRRVGDAHLSKRAYTHKCLVGDFDYRDINWVSWTTFRSEDSKEHKFIETIRDCYLHQHNQENSRRRDNDQSSLIDYMQISEVVHHAPLGKSEHNVICFKFNCYLDYSKPKERYRYGKAYFEATRMHMTEPNWKEQYVATADNKTAEELWTSVTSKLMDLRTRFVPKQKSSRKPAWKDPGSFPISKSL